MPDGFDTNDRIRYMVKRLGDLPTAAITWFFSDTASLYNTLGRQPGVGNYLNLGWWTDRRTSGSSVDAGTITEACRNLVREFAAFGELDPTDEILDVGFGFGQQDVLLAEEFDCRKITGINISPRHVKKGRKIIEENGLEDRVALHLGDAVNLPFEQNTFDTIFALETAFHFRTRGMFFAEAMRVLKPGGKLLTADIINGPERDEANVLQSYLARAHEAYWNIPAENRIDKPEYRGTLEQQGFEDVAIEDVSEHVIEPWVEHYLPWRFDRQPLPIRLVGRPTLKLLLNLYQSDIFSYVFTKSTISKQDK